MPSKNYVCLMGHVGSDPEAKVFDSGAKVVEFRMATTEKWKKGDEWQSETVWHSIKCWRFAADAAEKLAKGDLVEVEGKIKMDEWEKDGQKRTKLYIEAQKVQFLRNKNTKADADDGGAADDDLPF